MTSSLRLPIRQLGVLAAVLLAAPHASANAPAGRYNISNAIVLDTKTGLFWQQAASTMTFTQSGARTFCAGMGAGWRIPTIKELATIADFSAAYGLDSTFSMQSESWSASIYHSAATGWLFEFNWDLSEDFGPDSGPIVRSESYMTTVRCVK